MLIYTGTYTHEGSPAARPTGKGICCFELDEESGEIRFLHFTEQRNASYLVVSDDKRYLYALEEMSEDQNPRIYAYRIEESGKLRLINSQKLVGDYTCHLTIAKNQLLIANYMSGNVLAFPISKDGGLKPFTQLIQHTGKGSNLERQESAHAHMVFPYKGDMIFAVDLGIDMVKAYKFVDAENMWKPMPSQDIHINSGSGPRHMAMGENKDYAYVLGELRGEVFVFRNHTNRFELVQTVSILPEGFKGEFGGAALRIHPNGRFLYASCRGADVITVFRISNVEGTLERINIYSSGGKTPRDFNISPSGKWLIAANQDTNDLQVFKLNSESGAVTKHSSITTGTPVNICWG